MLRLLVATLAVALVGAVQPVKAAASPPNNRVALSLDYGAFTIDEETAPQGGVLTLEYERFFSDAMAVRVAAGGGYFTADETSYTAHAVLGLSYTIDNLQYQPYATVGIGGLLLSDERIEPGLGLYVEGGGGIDFIVNRSLALGVTFRFEAQLPRVSLFMAGARGVWRWGN